MRLRDLDPEVVAREIVGWVGDHIAALSVALSPAIVTPHGMTPDAWRSTDVGLAAYVLTVYAQTGVAPDDAPVAEYMLSIGQALWTAAHPAVYQAVPYPWGEGAGEPVEAVDVMLCAVQARQTLASEGRISVRELAVLGGIAEQSLRRFSSRGGGPRVAAGSVECGEAREWLLGRGLEGV